MDEQYDPKKVASNIRSLRERNGLTQRDLAKKLDVTYASVSKWETAQSMPRMGKIEKMAKLFGCTKSELIFGFKDPSGEALNQPEILRLYNQLNDKGQSKVVGYADDLVQSGRYKRISGE